jgi:hypothetical protein
MNGRRIHRLDGIDQRAVQVSPMGLAVIRPISLAWKIAAFGIDDNFTRFVMLYSARGRHIADMAHDVFTEQVIEHVATVRRNGYAGTDLTECIGLLVDGYPEAGFLQGQRRGQAADARTDNEYVQIFHAEKRRIRLSQVRIVLYALRCESTE